jgi:hypothetical protein
MDFPFTCHACRAPTPQPYRDDNQYAWECSCCGAANAAALRNERFEILFDFGALAFLDGYYREAVANFATSFERFLEFFVRTAWAHAGMTEADASVGWSEMAKQSERQLGTFFGTYLLACRSVPKMPAQKQVEFRNNVVHRGLIPTREQTARYATALYELTKQHLITLCAMAPRAVSDRVEHPAKEQGGRAKATGQHFAVYCYDGLFGVYRFTPESLMLETERSASEYPQAVIDGLRTDLDFLAALQAREGFLRAKFARPPTATPT